MAVVRYYAELTRWHYLRVKQRARGRVMLWALAYDARCIRRDRERTVKP